MRNQISSLPCGKTCVHSPAHIAPAKYGIEGSFDALALGKVAKRLAHDEALIASPRLCQFFE